jgi:hypothetical protein
MKYRIVTMIAIAAVSAACSITGLMGRNPDQSGAAEEQEAEELQGTSSGLSGQDVQQGALVGERRGSCPTEDEIWFLNFGHDFQVNTPYGPWRAAAWGNKPVYFYADGSIAVDPLDTLDGLVFAELADGDSFCSGSAFVDIHVSVDASCSDGVVSMTLYEDWRYQDFEMTCDDDSFQFPIPSYGSAEHRNLTFHLMDPGSAMQVHPFQGGSGQKTWILSFEPPLVPLVDPDDLAPFSEGE